MKAYTITKQNDKVEGLEQISDALSYARNGKYVVTIKQVRERRSVPQNALMWAWFNCIAESQNDGTTPDDVHDAYCDMFLSRNVTYKGRVYRITGETHKLNKAEMGMFLDLVQADAAQDGINLPTPEDRAFDNFMAIYNYEFEDK